MNVDDKLVLQIFDQEYTARGFLPLSSHVIGAPKYPEAVLSAVQRILYEDRRNRVVKVGSEIIDVNAVLTKDKLLRAITQERVDILDIIRAAQSKLSEGNPARSILQVLDGVIASRQHGDENRVKELA